MNELITYMANQWLLLHDGQLVIGVNEDGLDELEAPISIHLPEVGDTVEPGQVFGEIESENGPLNLYCPVDGEVIEINDTLIENPELLFDDCYDEGWLIRIEADSLENIDLISFQNEDDED